MSPLRCLHCRKVGYTYQDRYQGSYTVPGQLGEPVQIEHTRWDGCDWCMTRTATPDTARRIKDARGR